MATTLITGAGSGIGRAFAQALATRGDALVLWDVDRAGLDATAAQLAGSAIRTDVVDVADAEALQQAAARLPSAGLNLLINCAAILGPGTWSAQPADEFERVLRVDFLGTTNTIRGTLPHLRAARGHIVVLASTAAVHGWPGLAAYSAAKFAVTGWCDAVRAELARDGIGLTTVFPLLIDTPLLGRAGLPPILRQGRRIPPEAVVRKVLRAVERRTRRVYIPATVRAIAVLQGVAPSLLDWYGTRFGIERTRS